MKRFTHAAPPRRQSVGAAHDGREKMIKALTLVLVLALAFAAVASSVAAPLAGDPEGARLVQAAHRLISAYHAGEAKNQAVVRVVYFHPSDRDPLPDYAGRLDRVLTDISDFYRDGLRRFGIENDGLPLERQGGRLVLHMVRGEKPASGYQHDSGNETEAEVRAALKGTFDLDREHVLILYALCRKEPDGRHVFDAPYYGKGSSSQRAGLCHAADCELLDPRLLTETGRKIVYTEHYYPRVEQTVAKFNSWYLGGIAHELGHGLGLPHDSGQIDERRFGTSLMGGGNHTYRQEMWGGGEPTFLSRVSALQWLSHPLLTRSNRGRWDWGGVGFERLEFTAEEGVFRVAGKIVGAAPAHAVVAYTWPESSKTDHGARTFVAPVDDGRFVLPLAGLKRGNYNVRLVGLHANGGTTVWRLKLGFDAAGRPDIAAVEALWNGALVERAERWLRSDRPRARVFVSDDVIAHVRSSDVQRRLRALRAVLEPAAPTALTGVTGGSVFLSDVAWTEAKVGWGQPTRNHNWFDEKTREGVLFMLGGQFFDKGLYAHSPSRYVFPLDGKWKTLTAVAGLRDGAHSQGSARFIVRGEGRELFRSRVLRVGERQDLSVDVTGVNELELIAEGTEGHHRNSWAIWAAPAVQR